MKTGESRNQEHPQSWPEDTQYTADSNRNRLESYCESQMQAIVIIRKKYERGARYIASNKDDMRTFEKRQLDQTVYYLALMEDLDRSMKLLQFTLDLDTVPSYIHNGTKAP
eukprot:scaffold3120_cov73-Cylindrotheca_fusiformis.AAC.2